MATVTYNCTKDASAYYNSDAWSGYDNHHPVGQSPSGSRWASLLYFPISFTGMTSITSATLKLYGAKVANVTHTSGSSSTTIYARRMTSDWGEGTNRGENLWSGQETWNWSNRVAAGNTTTGQISITTGPVVNNTLYNFDITSLVRLWAPTSAGGSNFSNFGLLLLNSSTASADAVEYYSRHVSGYVPQLTIVYETNTAPSAPTGLSPTGGQITTTSPLFQGTRSDPDAGDQMNGYELFLYNNVAGTSPYQVWTSGQVAIPNATTFTVPYTGATTLIGNTTYYWKAATRDTNGNQWGAFSTLQSFKPNNVPPAPTGLSPSGVTVTTTTPTFKGTSSDADPGDQLSAFQIGIYTDSLFTNAVVTPVDIATSGSTFSWTTTTALTLGQTYYWRARTKDTNGEYSDWSQASFTVYASGPSNLSPANTKVNTLTPTFTATASGVAQYEIVVMTSDGVTTHAATSTITGATISWTYNLTPALAWGTKYYWKVRTAATVGGTMSAYSTPQPFWTNSAPIAQLTSPLPGAVVTTATPTFTSTYTDGDVSNGFADPPTSYYVEVYTNAGTPMFSLTKSASLSTGQNTVYAGEVTATPISGGATTLTLNQTYKWRARFTDSSAAANAQGLISDFRTFRYTAAPTVTAFAAAAGDLSLGSLATPTPTLSWTVTYSGGKTQSYFTLSVVNAGQTIYGPITQSVSTASFQLPSGIFENAKTYTINLTVGDTDSLEASSSVTYTTAWTPPDAVANLSATGDSTRGYVFLDWDTSSLSSTDFREYFVYRSSDGGSTWTLLDRIVSRETSHYADYSTSIGSSYAYKVTQWKKFVNGSGVETSSPLESAASIVYTTLDTDVWWLVMPDRDDLCMPLYVDDESHSSPFQQEVFEPFGRSRKVIVRSGQWGREGSLSFYILPEDRVDHLNRLSGIQALNSPVYLKSPFGDNHLVYLDPATVSYLPGGGAKVGLNYTEVDA